MIFTDFQLGIVAALAADLYFTPASGTAIAVLGEAQPGTREAVQSAIDTVGVVAVVSKPKMNRGDNRVVTATSTVVIIENNKLNQTAVTGTQKLPEDIGWHAWGLLENKIVNDQMRPLRGMSLEQNGEDDGLVIWELQVATDILITIT